MTTDHQSGAETLGQAAKTAWMACPQGDDPDAAWEAAAQAAIDAFLAGDSVSAESIREALAAQQPQPAPGGADLRDALERIITYSVKAIHDIAADTLVALGGARKPVPELATTDMLIRDILESLCRRAGISLESTVDPGEPARNYALAERLGIGHVFGLPDSAPAAPQAREFRDRFTIIPDTGMTELDCFRCSGMPRMPRGNNTVWSSYHPSLDVLIEKARTHDADVHADAAPQAAPGTAP